ncbi:MAG TPA: DUF445 domain-containing protein [Paucimonas sp.]|nr:DUF445 domain-containing protein [Paucimonas sp.]
MQDEAQATQLRRMRALATALLVAMAILLFATRSLEHLHPGISFVAAFAEAALVGALADWFAVTALFRSPLGLPIPHTAVIPKSKDRIGSALSDFIQYNFITREIIHGELRSLDFADTAAAWLSNPENARTVSRQAARTVPLLLEFVDDEDMRKTLLRHADSALQRVKIAPALAEVVSALASKGYHQDLFAHLVEMASQVFEHNKPYIRWKIHEGSPRWLPKAVDEKIYERLLHAIRSTLDEMREDDSEWRMRFQHAVDRLIEHLRTSPEYETKLGVILHDISRHPALDSYALELWRDVKARLSADALADESLIVAKLEEIAGSLCKRLAHDLALRTAINAWLSALFTEIVVARREFIAGLIARVIRKWDAETMSRKLELQVGKDLQYIRINGTLVGGLVGVILHTIPTAMGP